MVANKRPALAATNFLCAHPNRHLKLLRKRLTSDEKKMTLLQILLAMKNKVELAKYYLVPLMSGRFACQWKSDT